MHEARLQAPTTPVEAALVALPGNDNGPRTADTAPEPETPLEVIQMAFENESITDRRDYLAATEMAEIVLCDDEGTPLLYEMSCAWCLGEGCQDCNWSGRETGTC